MCRPENIANAPHAPNLDVAANLGQLFAEPRHLRLKRIGLNLVIEAVDRLDQDFARDDAVASHQKGFEDQGFAAAKEDLVTGPGDLCTDYSRCIVLWASGGDRQDASTMWR